MLIHVLVVVGHAAPHNYTSAKMEKVKDSAILSPRR